MARRVLVVDVGGSNIKIIATGHRERLRAPSGPGLTPRRMVSVVKRLTRDWRYDVVSIGYPGIVEDGRPVAEPHNLARGWVRFDYERAFGCPVRIVNDAVMQALGSYRRGTLLFLGLGTGLGACAVVGGRAAPLELAHLPYKRGSYEDHLGVAALRRKGRSRWSREVAQVVAALQRTLRPDEVVLGGGNAKRLTRLPKRCRLGSNARAFDGGVRLWRRSRRRLR